MELDSSSKLNNSVITLCIPSPFVIILTLWSLLLGPGAVPTDTTLSNRKDLGRSAILILGNDLGRFKECSLSGFPAQSVVDLYTQMYSDSPCLLVIILPEVSKQINTNILQVTLPCACLMLAQAGYFHSSL
ncbi:hypothetical protein Tco_0363901 [Tanacetum coccineum]